MFRFFRLLSRGWTAQERCGQDTRDEEFMQLVFALIACVIVVGVVVIGAVTM